MQNKNLDILENFFIFYVLWKEDLHTYFPRQISNPLYVKVHQSS